MIKFYRRWLGITAVLLILLTAAACANPEETSIPTQAPLADVKDEEPNSAADTAEEQTNELEEGTAGEVDDAPTDGGVETAEDVSDEELAALPGIDPAQMGGGAAAPGLGGGGGGGLAVPEAASSDMVIDEDFPIVNLFEGTVFTLDTVLPTEPVRAPVEQKSEFSIRLEEAQQIARRFGFEGPLYRQPVPEGVEQVGSDPLLNVYFAFDDNGRMLNIDGFGAYYSNSNYQYEDQPNLSFEQLAPIAEAFLSERGLLDFEYQLSKGWGNEIWVTRLIRGVPLNQPEMTVGVDNDGNVFYVSMQRFSNLERLGNYPLRSAEAAWADLNDGVNSNEIAYSFAPIFDEQPLPVEPAPSKYQYWQRTYQPGQNATIYTWPTVYLSADGSAPPRIEAYPFRLTGDTETLQTIAEQPFSQFRFEGVVSDNGRALNVTNWESIGQTPENLYLQGTVKIEGDQTLFLADNGNTYIIPNAPADLPLDERFNIFAWDAVETGAAYPELAWESMDVFVNFDEVIIEEPVVIEDLTIYEPTPYETVRISDVSLIYFISYVFLEFDEANPIGQPPQVLVKPVWRFRGETNTGDVIDLFVDAVAPEYIE